MAPGILSDRAVSHENEVKSKSNLNPINPTGVLDKFGFEDVTPVIGREFPSLNIVDDLLQAEDADALLRELAVTSEFIILNPFSI
jgi:hypothetical protein